MRQTKIIATIGPVTESFEMLQKLAENGVNIFRLNFSHGEYSWHEAVIKRIKKLNRKFPKNLAIMLDTKGPEIRTGDLPQPIVLKKNQKIILTVEHDYDPQKKIGVSYDEFINDIEIGKNILIDNGVMNFKILEKKKKDIICEVLDSGTLTSRRHINIPGKEVSLEAITKKDWDDINFGLEMGIDFIALSFVRNGEEIQTLKKFLEEKNSKIDIIAKVESYEATKNLKKIIDVADGIMVARGDLGAEVPFSHVPRLQRKMIEMSAIDKKPVIVATHMLESMIKNPIPTRAEVSDISAAVKQSADCIMLSGETAGGSYPIKSVQAMSEIALETEKDFLVNGNFRDLPVKNNHEEFCRTAARMIQDLQDAKAIFVITRSGYIAQILSAFRPKCPIFAFTNTPSVRRKMQILWGVFGFRIDFSSDPEKTIKRAQTEFLEKYPKWKNKKYILISDILVEENFVTNLQIRYL